jgi:shikimate dehydrogenase
MNKSSTHVFSFGLIGWPVAHSLSPHIHQAAFQATGLPGEYRLYPVEPATAQEEIQESLLDKLRDGTLHGLNVTVPHKERALDWVDRLSGTAQAVGAVNTLSFQNNQIMGDNTDAQGFLNHLSRLKLLAPGNPKRCLILGAGGSARAAAFSLAQAGHLVTIVARRVEQAMCLVEHLNRSPAVITPIQALPFDPDMIQRQSSPEIFVNTTPVGMHPHTEQSPWPLEIPLPQGCLVYDMIYNPAETQLLHAARRQGLPAINGLGMLVEQAARSFSIWTATQPPLEPLYQAVGLNLTSIET